MMAESTDIQIDRIIVNTEAKLLAVVRSSIDDLVTDMQKPVSKGGRMRVDTGFLRASAAAALNQLPRGLKRGRKRNSSEKGIIYPYDEQTGFINPLLTQMKIGDTFYFGWSASYAKYREAYDGFLEAGVQNWQKYVNKAVRKFKNLDARK